MTALSAKSNRQSVQVDAAAGIDPNLVFVDREGFQWNLATQ